MSDLSYKFEAIGTSWEIEVKSPKVTSDAIKEKIDKEIREFSGVFSRFKKDSEIFKASLLPRKIRLPIKYYKLIEIYEKLYKLTDKSFTPLIGNLLIDTGYDDTYSLTPRKIRPLKNWDEIIDFNPPFLKIKERWMLDFGAGGKGFLVDLIGSFLEKEGISDFCIDGSGDILYKTSGLESLRVGLENPQNISQVIGVAEIINQSICASSGNRRKWGSYHHIFNPHSLKSVEEILSVWVITDSAFVADCLATCLFLTNPEKLEKEFEFEYLILYPDYTVKKSPQFLSQIYYN